VWTSSFILLVFAGLTLTVIAGFDQQSLILHLFTNKGEAVVELVGYVILLEMENIRNPSASLVPF
jgi:hypothetical protein